MSKSKVNEKDLLNTAGKAGSEAGSATKKPAKKHFVNESIPALSEELSDLQVDRNQLQTIFSAPDSVRSLLELLRRKAPEAPWELDRTLTMTEKHLLRHRLSQLRLLMDTADQEDDRREQLVLAMLRAFSFKAGKNSIEEVCRLYCTAVRIFPSPCVQGAIEDWAEGAHRLEGQDPLKRPTIGEMVRLCKLRQETINREMRTIQAALNVEKNKFAHEKTAAERRAFVVATLKKHGFTQQIQKAS